MKKIGVLFGMENTFPGALVDHINAREIEGIRARNLIRGWLRSERRPLRMDRASFPPDPAKSSD